MGSTLVKSRVSTKPPSLTIILFSFLTFSGQALVATDKKTNKTEKEIV